MYSIKGAKMGRGVLISTDKKDSYIISAVSAYEKNNDGKEMTQKRTANINKRQGKMVGQCSCYGSSQNLLTKEAEWWNREKSG